MNIGKNIRMRRESLGLEQKELAKRIGVSPAMICYIENGKNKLSFKVAIALADVFKCSIDELIDRKVS